MCWHANSQGERVLHQWLLPPHTPPSEGDTLAPSTLHSIWAETWSSYAETGWGICCVLGMGQWWPLSAQPRCRTTAKCLISGRWALGGGLNGLCRDGMGGWDVIRWGGCEHCQRTQSTWRITHSQGAPAPPTPHRISAFTGADGSWEGSAPEAARILGGNTVISILVATAPQPPVPAPVCSTPHPCTRSGMNTTEQWM